MSLIATNRIAAYIALHPKARIPLLLWLKERTYNPRIRLTDAEGKPMLGVSKGVAYAQPGGYVITYLTNYLAKTLLITHVENQQEQQERIDRDFAEAEKRNPGKVRRITKVFTTTIQSPEPGLAQFTNPDSSPAEKTVTSAASNNLAEPGFDNFDFTNVVPLQSAEAYAQALHRAEAIFSAQPGEPEFDELLALLPRLQQYEHRQLTFPALQPFEAVKQRMEILHMPPEALNRLMDTDIARRFLNGETELDEAVLQQIYAFLHLKFHPGDRRF